MQERAFNNPKIEILWDSVIEEVMGDTVVRKVKIKISKPIKRPNAMPRVSFLPSVIRPIQLFLNGQIDLHDNGYIKVEPGTCQTSKELVLACGDAQDHVYRQAITAAGTGCMAAIEAERELSARGLIK